MPAQSTVLFYLLIGYQVLAGRVADRLRAPTARCLALRVVLVGFVHMSVYLFHAAPAAIVSGRQAALPPEMLIHSSCHSCVLVYMLDL